MKTHKALINFKVVPSSERNKVIAGSLRNCFVSLWPSEQHVGDHHHYKKMRGKPFSGKAILFLTLVCFLGGTLFTSQIWTRPATTVKAVLPVATQVGCDHKRKLSEGKPGDVMEEVSKTHKAIQSLEKAVSTLEMELAAARRRSQNNNNNNNDRQKAFVVIGINTAFSSKHRRESLRQTWMPTGNELKELEKKKGIVMRFMIGHSATPGGILDKAIDEEAAQYKDFLRLDHVEGYHELSSKTRLYFSTVVSLWDAEFYMKVDDDIHLNLGMLVSTLAKYRSRPRVYIGCMKSGPVLYQKGVKYHEPEHWKFGEEGNKYFRHATGQIYAISKDLATYISINWPILHGYANEDVSLGSWLFGLEVQHVDERSMCCGTPPDCDWKARAGNVCVASFDWTCSGICRSVEKMKSIHKSCGEGEGAIWNVEL